MNGSVSPVHGQNAHDQGSGVDATRPAANEPDPGFRKRLRMLTGGGGRTLFFYLLTAAVLVYGWMRRGDVYLSPEQGAGYVLGIVGGVMMLLLLLYPVRKHAAWARGLGRVSHWFRAHMILGIVGPVCVLYHCNFQLGSTNGNVALFSMLLVATSGLAGRYFYTRIHYGLYGKKADLAMLGSDALASRAQMDEIVAEEPLLGRRLHRLERSVNREVPGLLPGLVQVVVIWIRTRWCGLISRPRLNRAVHRLAGKNNWSDDEYRGVRQASHFYMQTSLETTRRVAGFRFYERLFSLWHVLHLPLFIMLVLSGVVHVYAVHLY